MHYNSRQFETPYAIVVAFSEYFGSVYSPGATNCADVTDVVSNTCI